MSVCAVSAYGDYFVVSGGEVVEEGTSTHVDADKVFLDVKTGTWYYTSIAYGYNAGLIKGLTDTYFGLNETLTRAQFIVLLGRLKADDEITAQTTPSDNWYSAYVRYFSDMGVLNAIPTDDTSLNQGIPRQEMALLVYNIWGGYHDYIVIPDDSVNAFSDASSMSSAYKTAVNFASYIGVIRGYDDGTFGPNKTLTRAEGCAILYRISYWNVDSLLETSVSGMQTYLSWNVMNQAIAQAIYVRANEKRAEKGYDPIERLEILNQGAAIRAAEYDEYYSTQYRTDGVTYWKTVYSEDLNCESKQVSYSTLISLPVDGDYSWCIIDETCNYWVNGISNSKMTPLEIADYKYFSGLVTIATDKYWPYMGVSCYETPDTHFTFYIVIHLATEY